MKRFMKSFGVLALAATWLAGTAAVAADPDWTKYDGSVKIEAKQFALIIGGSEGGGTLTFQGKTYEFKLTGLTFGVNVGGGKTEGNGFVYNLTDVAKFPGKYTAYTAAGTLGGGVGTVYLKNENGVIMKLGTTSKGAQLNLSSASGVTVKMK